MHSLLTYSYIQQIYICICTIYIYSSSYMHEVFPCKQTHLLISEIVVVLPVRLLLSTYHSSLFQSKGTFFSFFCYKFGSLTALNHFIGYVMSITGNNELMFNASDNNELNEVNCRNDTSSECDNELNGVNCRNDTSLISGFQLFIAVIRDKSLYAVTYLRTQNQYRCRGTNARKRNIHECNVISYTFITRKVDSRRGICFKEMFELLHSP